MMSEVETTELAPRQAVEFWSQFGCDNKGNLKINNAGGLSALASVISKSGMGPKGMTREQLFVAMWMGNELGLTPLQSIRSVAVINGRPALWGDAMLGLVRNSGMLEQFVETFEGDGETLTAVCTVKRKGMPDAHVETFSVADAKRAGLWGKGTTWSQYPKRMLRMRARGFALRDQFGDVLSGVISREEAEDTPEDTTPTVLPVVAATVPTVVEPKRRRREPQPEVPVETPAPVSEPTPDEAEAIREAEAKE